MIYKLQSKSKFPFELRRYKKRAGGIPLSEWLDDQDNTIRARILAYVDRMKAGNFGNSRPVGDGVSELKIDFGSGYRVYYIQDGPSIVVLLCAGDKSTQQTDISRAKEYAKDYWRRK